LLLSTTGKLNTKTQNGRAVIGDTDDKFRQYQCHSDQITIGIYETIDFVAGLVGPGKEPNLRISP
jgi:hypothetical protein